MEQHRVTVTSVEKVTRDVLGIRTTKPDGYSFNPGQATEIATNTPGCEEAKEPFTFTDLRGSYSLGFTIKIHQEKRELPANYSTSKQERQLDELGVNKDATILEV